VNGVAEREERKEEKHFKKGRRRLDAFSLNFAVSCISLRLFAFLLYLSLFVLG
jgi:hypothetical protein